MLAGVGGSCVAAGWWWCCDCGRGGVDEGLKEKFANIFVGVWLVGLVYDVYRAERSD